MNLDDEEFDKSFNDLKLERGNGVENLTPRKLLHTYFTDVSKDYLHIVVQLPATGESSDWPSSLRL